MITQASTTAFTDARLATTHAWTLFTQTRNLRARIPDWRTRTTLGGQPVLSVEVAGPGAAHALRLFAADNDNYPLTGHGPGDLRPHLDVDTPGRTVLMWRSSGVWVELWHPDTVTTLPAAPTPPVRPAARPGLLSRASARLPYTRRSTTKETSR